MARTFAELERDDTVTAAEVCEVLEDYATSGAAINNRVVIDLIRRTNPNETERARMKVSAENGRDSQVRRGFSRAATDYEYVIRHLVQ